MIIIDGVQSVKFILQKILRYVHVVKLSQDQNLIVL